MPFKLDKSLKLIRDLNPNSLILLKMGSFYHAYGKDAYLLAYLFGYQLKTLDGSLSTCGFPISALGKIERELGDKKINYIQIVRSDNYAVEEDVSFKSENQYNEYTDRAYKFILKKNRVDNISAYLIDNINDENFNEKISKIEEILY